MKGTFRKFSETEYQQFETFSIDEPGYRYLIKKLNNTQEGELK